MLFSNLYNVHYCLELIYFENLLAIFLIGKIVWILWVLISQINKRDITGLFFLIHLFTFIVEGDSVFVKVYLCYSFINVINISVILFFPKYAYKAYACQTHVLFHTTIYTRVLLNVTKWMKRHPFCGACSSINI